MNSISSGQFEADGSPVLAAVHELLWSRCSRLGREPARWAALHLPPATRHLPPATRHPPPACSAARFTPARGTGFPSLGSASGETLTRRPREGASRGGRRGCRPSPVRQGAAFLSSSLYREHLKKKNSVLFLTYSFKPLNKVFSRRVFGAHQKKQEPKIALRTHQRRSRWL